MSETSSLSPSLSCPPKNEKSISKENTDFSYVVEGKESERVEEVKTRIVKNFVEIARKFARVSVDALHGDTLIYAMFEKAEKGLEGDALKEAVDTLRSDAIFKRVSEDTRVLNIKRNTQVSLLQHSTSPLDGKNDCNHLIKSGLVDELNKALSQLCDKLPEQNSSKKRKRE